MTTRQILLDLGRCLRAAAAPLLTLGVITLARTVHATSPSPTTIDQLLTPAWKAAITSTLLWLLLAVAWAASRPWRDRRAFQRLQRLRELAARPNRVLVLVKTAIWNTAAGQQAVVVNIATGVLYRIWLPETTVPVGAFAVLERTSGGVSLVDWMNAAAVEPAHRHEARRARTDAAVTQTAELARSRHEREAAAELVRETEEFLKNR